MTYLDLLLLLAYLVGIIRTWAYVWPRLLLDVIQEYNPDGTDYLMSGFASLWFAIIWPLTLAGVFAGKYLMRLGEYLYKKHAS